MKNFERLKEERDIKKWLRKPQPRTVSGRFYFPIPPLVYEPMGGFKELDKKYRQWRKEDESD